MSPEWYEYSGARRWQCPPVDGDAAGFHRTWPGYAATPLVDSPELAADLEVGRLLVKDETRRLGLPSFKILGASWAIARAMSTRIGAQSPTAFADLVERIHPLAPVVLVAATEGNHGRAVAHVSRLLGLGCRVFVPETAEAQAVAAIESEQAEVTLVAGPYDEAVRRAADFVSRAGHDALLIQDTAWSGYTEIPGWVVEGYSTLFSEIDMELGDLGRGGLVAVPVGVGSLLQAALAHYRSGGGPSPPAVLGVEPDSADCVLRSLSAGELKTVQTGATTMTGLNCGTPSSLAWPYIRNGLDGAIAVSDDDAAVAVEDLAAAGIATRPTGAAALAGARAALTDGACREALGVDGRSTVVVLCTEGPGETSPQDR